MYQHTKLRRSFSRGPTSANLLEDGMDISGSTSDHVNVVESVGKVNGTFMAYDPFTNSVQQYSIRSASGFAFEQ